MPVPKHTVSDETERQLTEFREHLREIGRAPNTVKGYVADMRNFAHFLGQPLWPAHPDLETQVKLWLTSRRKEGVKTPSVRRSVFAVKAYYQFAGMGQTLTKIVAPKGQPYTTTLITTVDVEYLLAEINAVDPQCYDFYRLIILAGFRYDELCDIELAQSDIDAKQVTVVDPAGLSRVVVLGSQSCEVFQRVLERGGWTHSKTRLRKTVENTANRLRIDGVSCHTLRATCAARMMAAGHTMINVKKNLGYRSDMTLSLIKRTATSEHYADLI